MTHLPKRYGPLTLFEVRALPRRNQEANLSDKRIAPSGPYKSRIKGTLHLPHAPR
jgi:hypothetical protein